MGTIKAAMLFCFSALTFVSCAGARSAMRPVQVSPAPPAAEKVTEKVTEEVVEEVRVVEVVEEEVEVVVNDPTPTPTPTVPAPAVGNSDSSVTVGAGGQHRNERNLEAASSIAAASGAVALAKTGDGDFLPTVADSANLSQALKKLGMEGRKVGSQEELDRLVEDVVAEMSSDEMSETTETEGDEAASDRAQRAQRVQAAARLLKQVLDSIERSIELRYQTQQRIGGNSDASVNVGAQGQWRSSANATSGTALAGATGGMAFVKTRSTMQDSVEKVIERFNFFAADSLVVNRIPAEESVPAADEQE